MPTVSNLLYESSRPLALTDVRDTYTYLGYYNKLSNYTIYNIGGLIEKRLKRGTDISNYIYDFIGENGEVLGIANIINGIAYSIKFKSLKEKKFLTYGTLRAMPYGIGDLEGLTYGTPIVLVEGEKDRDSCKELYPYVLSASTSGTSLMMREILLTLTNKFILYYDGDEAGRKACSRDSYFFKGRGCQVSIGEHPKDTKDIGTLTDLKYSGDTFKLDFLNTFYKSQIQVML